MTKHEETWMKLVADFRQACILRREGRVQESNSILNRDLPERISQWSKYAPQDGGNRRAILENMIKEEQRRVEDAWVVHRILAEKLKTELLPVMCTEVAHHIKGIMIEGLEYLGATQNRTPQRSSASRSSSGKAESTRIKFDDLPRIIDAVIAEDAADFGPKKVLAFMNQ